MNKLNIKPLSVNQCWQGRRFKTKAYKQYENEMLSILPIITIPDGNLTLNVEVGYSNSSSDIDNFLKPFLDILQKKYGFNDSRINRLFVYKEKTKKGDEHIKFHLEKS